MPPPIEELAGQLLRDHVTVMVTPPATTAQRVAQRVMFVAKDNKRKVVGVALEGPSLFSGACFCSDQVRCGPIGQASQGGWIADRCDSR